MITITYCKECLFKPRAEELRDSLREEFGDGIKLEEGHNGVFDVRYGDNLIFSMHEKMRFPTQDEIKEEIKKLK